MQPYTHRLSNLQMNPRNQTHESKSIILFLFTIIALMSTFPVAELYATGTGNTLICTPAEISSELWLDAEDDSTITIAHELGHATDVNDHGKDKPQDTYPKPTYSGKACIMRYRWLTFDYHTKFCTEEDNCFSQLNVKDP